MHHQKQIPCLGTLAWQHNRIWILPNLYYRMKPFLLLRRHGGTGLPARQSVFENIYGGMKQETLGEWMSNKSK